MRGLRRSLYVLLFVLLTVLTQVGGVVLLVSTLLVWSLVSNRQLSGWRAFPVHFFIFIAIYAAGFVVLAPIMAQWSGRVALQCIPTQAQPYGAYTPLLCLMNRQYVRPELRDAVEAMAQDLAEQHPGTVTAYLDANFPLLDGFPLLPHQSHKDGRKIDLAYFFQDANGTYKPMRTPSPIGYWGFVQPSPDAELPCANGQPAFTLRWDLDWLQRYWKPLQLDDARTASMLQWLVESGRDHAVSEILIEPHMATRLGVFSEIIGFAGCNSARHDDHIHVGWGEVEQSGM